MQEASMPQGSVRIERWPTEIPLLILVVFASALIWLLLAVSIIGIIYVGMIGLILFLAHVSFVAFLRGSAVRIGPEQFPHLHERVVTLAGKAGLGEPPVAYVMQAGGSLNALATRLFRSRFIVLFSDLLEACKDDDKARDMVIGHEMGHLHARHLDWLWVLAPGLIVPFLGSAYSRAREYTCDRYGAALCGDTEAATRGLTILAAGRELGTQVNRAAFVAQSSDLDTGFMTLGKWISGYPPLCDRVAALEPSLAAGRSPSIRGPVRATLLLGLLAVAPILAFGLFLAILIPNFQRAFETASAARDAEGLTFEPYEGDIDAARAQVAADFEALVTLARTHVAAGGDAPEDGDMLYDLWNENRAENPPLDPFDQLDYGAYLDEGNVLTLWSSGPDTEPGTDDDIEQSFALSDKASGS